MWIRWRRSAHVPIGSSRWWWRAISDIVLRLFGLVFLLIVLASGHATGVGSWLGLAVVVMMAPLLAIKIAACVSVLWGPNQSG